MTFGLPTVLCGWPLLVRHVDRSAQVDRGLRDVGRCPYRALWDHLFNVESLGVVVVCSFYCSIKSSTEVDFWRLNRGRTEGFRRPIINGVPPRNSVVTMDALYVSVFSRTHLLGCADMELRRRFHRVAVNDIEVVP
jgi:hypothetical protein